MGRLALSLIFGAAVGWERELQDKPAGLRTHMLVSLGAALILQIPIQLGIAQEDANAFSRIIQGIATGIGFLGAGEIVTQKKPSNSSDSYRVRGLTSAAAIWVSAALGMVAACGLWKMGLMGIAFAWLVLRAFKILERWQKNK